MAAEEPIAGVTDIPPSTTSDPPAERVARVEAQARLAIALHFIGALTDWAAIAALTGLIWAKLIPGETFAWVIAGLAGGTVISKMRGKSSGSTAALLGLTGPVEVLRHLVGAIALATSLTLATASCAAVFAALPTIIAAANTASDVINAIADFVAQREHDHAIDVAITKARAALAAVREAAAGAKDVHDGNLQAALTAFQAAYQDVLDLVAPLGVHAPPEAGRLAAPSTTELIVPPAARLRLELEGRS